MAKKIPVTLVLSLNILLFLTARAPRATAEDGNSTSTEKPVLINCGATGSSKDDDGRVWSGDEGFSEALLSFTRVETAASSSLSSVPAVPHKTARVFTSAFTYPIPVTGDRFFLRLYFNPTDYGNLSASAAVFDVSCGPYALLKNFSTSYYAKALNLAYILREYSINASSSASAAGRMNLTFTPSSNVSDSYAFVNGIEVVSMLDIFTAQVPNLVGTFSPYSIESNWAMETMYRLNVGGGTLQLAKDTGNLYRLWSDDSNYIAGGALGITYAKMDNVTINYPSSVPEYIAPVDVYETARSMPWYDGNINLNYNMSWILTVDPGFYYLVRLHFCEIQYPFTLPNQRVFTIYVNNRSAVQDFDVISRSKGIGVPVYYDFVVVIPDGDKQVDLWVSLHPFVQFNPQYTNVILNGLEVFKLGVTGNNLAGPMPTMPPSNDPDPGKVLPGGSGGGNAGVIGGVVGGVVGLLLLISGLVFFCCCHRHRAPEEAGHAWLPLSITSSGAKTTTVSYGSSLPSNLCRHFTFAEIKAATNNFDEKLLLGVGGFGKVYRGSIDDGMTMVAIKRANPMSEQGLHEFQNEIEMLSKLRHRHLVSLIGYCEENGEMILVYDYMAHGTLREHLYKSKNQPLNWKQRLEICIGAARGLHYLHTGAKYTIIHRDVKTTNILLDDNLVSKVSDFGLSKTGPSLDNTHVSTVVKGSFGYLDPEYFRRQQLTEKSDVYSFGVVLFEVLCARPALMRDLPKEQVSLAEWALHCQKKGVLNDIIDPHLKGKIAPQCLKKFAENAEKCLADVGLDRPAMGDVLWNLEFALQLQENTEGKGAVGSWNSKSDDTGKDLYEQPSDPKMRTTETSMTTTLASVGIDDRSIASVDSDGLTPSTVFSQIMDTKGR